MSGAARGSYPYILTLRTTALQRQQFKKAARAADMNLTVWMRSILVAHASKVLGQNGSSRLAAPALPRSIG